MSEKRKSPKAGKPAPKGKVSGSPMDVGLLEQIVSLMASHDLNTVDVRDGDRRVILKRGIADAVVHAPQVVTTRPATNPAQAAPAESTNAAPDESRYLRITSPMVGTFYASPKPGEKAFVTTGSVVNEDSDVCIIEAMKTFNSIKAECHGTIARVLIQDGHPVEFGTVLFLVNPS